MDAKALFLQDILSVAGYNALAKSADKAPALWKVLVPRTLLGYLTVQKAESTFAVPVLGGNLTKTADGWSGMVGETSIAKASDAQMAAVLTLLLGHDPQDLQITHTQAQRLGKSIDALIQTALLAKAMKPQSDAPGQANMPREAQGPMAPTPPTASQPAMANAVKGKGQPNLKGEKRPRLPRRRTALKLSMDAVNKSCSDCGGKMFKAERFTGCVCYRELAKSIITTRYADGITLDLSRLDEDSTAALLLEFQ